MVSITWQPRAGRVAEIKNGRSRPWAGTVDELLRRATSVTLLTRAGSEVILGKVKPQGAGCWVGEVLKTAPGAGHLSLGMTLEFHENNVQGGTP